MILFPFSPKNLLFGALILMTAAGNAKVSSFPSDTSATPVKVGATEGEISTTSVDSATAAQTLIDAQIVSVQSTFRNMTAPYPGQITAVVECNTRKFVSEKVVHFENKKSTLILAVANNRRIFGSCLLEDVKYVSAVWAAYDENKKQVVRVRLFMPVADAKKIEAAQNEILKVFYKIIPAAKAG